MASFASAIDVGVEIIECDVHVTTDRRLAVIHDATLERTTSGKGAVGRCTLAQLQQLDAGNGEVIPSLEEVLDLARGKVGVAIEVKPSSRANLGVETLLVEILRRCDMTAECAVISFDHGIIHRLRDLEPGLLRGVLVAGRPLMLPELLAYAGAHVYSPHWSFADEETVATVHRCGAAVGVWTVDDTPTLDASMAAGVDAIYTNRPREMMAAMNPVPPPA